MYFKEGSYVHLFTYDTSVYTLYQMHRPETIVNDRGDALVYLFLARGDFRKQWWPSAENNNSPVFDTRTQATISVSLRPGLLIMEQLYCPDKLMYTMLVDTILALSQQWKVLVKPTPKVAAELTSHPYNSHFTIIGEELVRVFRPMFHMGFVTEKIKSI